MPIPESSQSDHEYTGESNDYVALASEEQDLDGTSSSATMSDLTNNKTPATHHLYQAKITRMQEKMDMQSLNDRLLNYIENVRKLKSENVVLQKMATACITNTIKDGTEIKGLFEKKFSDLNEQLSKLWNEKARLELELSLSEERLAEALAKLTARDQENKKLSNQLGAAEQAAADTKIQLENLRILNTKLLEENAQLKPELEDAVRELNKMKRQYETEMLARVDLEAKLHQMEQEAKFNSEVYKKEIERIRSAKSMEIQEVDDKLRMEYDSRLAGDLQRIRAETEDRIRDMREDLERRYRTKLTDTSVILRESQFDMTLKDEIQTYRTRSHEMEKDINALKQKVSTNEDTIRELEEKLRNSNLRYQTDMDTKTIEYMNLKKQYDMLTDDFNEVYDIKIALDMEIAAYRKLLESEEERLQITTSNNIQQSTNINNLLNESLNISEVDRQMILEQEHNAVQKLASS